MAWKTEKENMEGDQPVESHVQYCIAAIATTKEVLFTSLQPQTCIQEHCLGETGLPSSAFQAVSELSLVVLFKVLNNLSSVGSSGRKQYS